jgi:predicted nucleic acid-binding protein
MKKVFVDTNIVMDLLLVRKPFYEDASRLFSLADRGKIQIYISALTFINLHYLLKKTISLNELHILLGKFKAIVTLLHTNDKMINLAFSSKFKDFEDAVQHYTAVENGIEMIVTRNINDFKESLITVLTPGEYLKLNNHLI